MGNLNFSHYSIRYTHYALLFTQKSEEQPSSLFLGAKPLIRITSVVYGCYVKIPPSRGLKIQYDPSYFLVRDDFFHPVFRF
ncbi:hypothetical protein B0I21_107251 [Sphingobacterium paludis]|uniref:Uncharacterized protein n=1 Tax=Sphingobacterium paludis TaxID=1476465 RepID=A0A4R7CTZ9_9SPHI|nr:hypothetical protein B0I21_107251 [Sphingobacterium paludis]